MKQIIKYKVNKAHTALLVLVCLLAAFRVSADPVGMVCHMKGASTYVDSQRKMRPLKMLQKLEPGDQVQCGDGSEVIVVIFGNGERFSLTGSQTGTVRAGGVEGAKPLGGLQGPSAAAIKNLHSARVGMFLSRLPLPIRRDVSQTNDWTRESNRMLRLTSISRAASYDLTFYDTYDNGIWTSHFPAGGQEKQFNVSLPAEAKLALHKPYIWRLSATLKDGIHSDNSYWGVLTVLPDEVADSMDRQNAALREEQKANLGKPNSKVDVMRTTLFAYQCRENGVWLRALELLNDLEILGEQTAEPSQEILNAMGNIGQLFYKEQPLVEQKGVPK